ncbi:MAG: ABC transporter ATP-binding protein/permease [Clostridiales bacterium]|nr:ABC transporter ATP-binding protein/permease [Clostridiales bacterium]
MLKLNNVSKSYISKSKQEVPALKNIDLEISDRGMVFILGKSGSGKSTLLNILGGLDSATGGEIFVDNQSFADFKQADYDNYRNQYVGFVFQEFNLLNDFDVANNVALALRLSKEAEITDKVAAALQSVGLSSDYLTRKIDELSGGEKQRVAIARAIVKDSRMILADEPTGNLDSETGESIWNILKDLSDKKLVIVVTHDRESAEKYGDRIIEISDGKIISDSGEQPATQEKENSFSPTRKKLSNAACFKMGANNLLKRKVKTVSVVLVAIFTIFTILLTQVLLSFSAEKSLAKFISDNNIDYITVTQGKLRYGNEFRHYGYPLRPSTRKYLKENSKCIENNCIEKQQDIFDMGLSFVGDALELDDYSYYITTVGLEEAYYEINSYVEIDGEKVELVKEEHPAAFLVGKRLHISEFSTDYTLAGVVDISSCSPLIKDSFPRYFVKESSEKVRYYGVYQDEVEPTFTIQFGKVKYSKGFETCSSLADVANRNGGKILTAQGLQDFADVTLSDDEIVFSYDMYSRLFDVSPQGSYVNSDLTQVKSTPQHIGQSLDVKFFEHDTGELLINAGKLKIAGIVFSRQAQLDNGYRPKFATGANTATKINKALSNSRFLVYVGSVDNLREFLVNLRSEHEGYVLHVGIDESGDYSEFVYYFEQEIYLFKIIFLSIAILLTIILILLVINLISFSIVSRKREIGILSALGATNSDITKIFLIETLLISVITFIINLAAILVSVYVFNSILCSQITLSVSLLRFDYLTAITLFVASFVLLLLAALIPLRKIIKLKPVEAIKNL